MSKFTDFAKDLKDSIVNSYFLNKGGKWLTDKGAKLLAPGVLQPVAKSQLIKGRILSFVGKGMKLGGKIIGPTGWTGVAGILLNSSNTIVSGAEEKRMLREEWAKKKLAKLKLEKSPSIKPINFIKIDEPIIIGKHIQSGKLNEKTSLKPISKSKSVGLIRVTTPIVITGHMMKHKANINKSSTTKSHLFFPPPTPTRRIKLTLPKLGSSLKKYNTYNKPKLISSPLRKPPILGLRPSSLGIKTTLNQPRFGSSLGHRPVFQKPVISRATFRR
jgi:hypothetical protein